MREFEHNGEWYEVDDYLPEHHFQNQTVIEPCRTRRRKFGFADYTPLADK